MFTLGKSGNVGQTTLPFGRSSGGGGGGHKNVFIITHIIGLVRAGTTVIRVRARSFLRACVRAYIFARACERISIVLASGVVARAPECGVFVLGEEEYHHHHHHQEQQQRRRDRRSSRRRVMTKFN